MAKRSGTYSPADAFAKKFVRPLAGRTLIVGSRVYEGREDRRGLYADAVGVDMLDGPGVDLVANLEEPQPGLGLFAHIECWSVLEHSRRPWKMAETLQSLMQPGATIHLSVPWVWRFHAYPDDYWRISDQGVRALFDQIDWQQLTYAARKLKAHAYLQAHEIEGHPYLPRCEVLGFGVRR